jgi:hypothetical protein
MSVVSPAAAAAPSSTGDAGGLFVMTYDATGLASVHIDGWPLIAWNVDPANPFNPAPITLGNPLKPPPTTGAIISPAWAYGISEEAVFIPDIWRGTMTEFFMWLATNHGANRKVSAWLTFPALLNVWNRWARENPDLVS